MRDELSILTAKATTLSVLLYDVVFPAKYQNELCLMDEVERSLAREVCLEIERRYETKFIEIGVDKDHVQFLVQSVPTYSVTTLVKMIKSLTCQGSVSDVLKGKTKTCWALTTRYESLKGAIFKTLTHTGF
jgi:REP element-mobilizing transposase RayT